MVGDKLVVSMHYTLTDNDGKTLDTSDGAEPLTYLHGAGNIITGLEQALVGKVVGDSLQVTVTPADGYGEVVPELMQTVPREMFQGVDEIAPGMAFEAEGEGGQVQRVMVREVSDTEVTVDANHPLAGMTLNFDVSIVDIRDATEEEIAHGHAH
ncbi:MAG: peptidylprolyl isomerase [Gammaproteobacteria bacterium]|nr:peptidylprolyl isomerase [Gammaproteobacteria bacterium]